MGIREWGAIAALFFGSGCAVREPPAEKTPTEIQLEQRINEFQEGLELKSKAEQEKDPAKRKELYAIAASTFYVAMMKRINTYDAILEYTDCLSLEGKALQAIEWADKAIKLNPNDAKAYHLKGLVHTRIDIYEAALPEFEKASELEDNPAYHWDCLELLLTTVITKNGIDASKADRLDRAIEVAKKYTKHTPDEPDGPQALYNAHAVRAAIYRNNGKQKEAEDELYSGYCALSRVIIMTGEGKTFQRERFKSIKLEPLKDAYEKLRTMFKDREH